MAMGEGGEARLDDSAKPLRLSFPARTDQVATARHAVAEFGREAGLDREALHDLETIVTEACMNSAAHAYSDQDGRIELAADVRGDEVAVVVRDHGVGIIPRPAPMANHRLGLVLIAALASHLEIRSRAGEGTELRVTLRAGSA